MGHEVRLLSCSLDLGATTKPRAVRVFLGFVCVCVCVCVSTPGQRVINQLRQGGQACHIQPGPTKLGCDRGSTKGRFGVYLPQLLHKLSNPIGLIHGGCMSPPTNRFSTTLLSRS